MSAANALSRPERCFAPTPAALADQVTLKNGDRLSGVIVKSDTKQLTLKSEFAGTVKISWEAIEAITSTAPLYVHLTSGDTLIDHRNAVF